MNKLKTNKLEKVRDAVNVCTMCGFCKSVCPSFKAIGWDSALARGRVILSYGLLTGDLEADDSVVKNIYTCTTCMDCVRRCPSKVNIVDIIELCRADLVENGHILPKHKAIADNILECGNPFGEKTPISEKLGQKPKKAKVGYFAGCTAAYRNQEISDAAMSIFKKLKIDFTTLDETCCGSVLQRIGWNDDDVKGLIKKNVSSIASLEVETLVLSCAGCYRMFKEEYPKYTDVPFEVMHMSEFLASQDMKLRPLKGIASYHDPCHLGRHAHVYDAPREVIRKIPELEFREMENTRNTSRCCGGGGGVRSAFPEESKTMAETRVDEGSFADIIITACPFCVSNLTLGLNDRDIRIVDLTVLVDELL